MEPKRSKYDTNPLDEKVADRAEQSWGSKQTENINSAGTSDIARNASDTARVNPESEAPTRRIDDQLGTSYPSVSAPPPPRQPVYQPPRVTPENIYQPPPVPPPGANESAEEAGLVSAFLGGVIVVPEQGTRLVTLFYRHSNPAFAAQG